MSFKLERNYWEQSFNKVRDWLFTSDFARNSEHLTSVAAKVRSFGACPGTHFTKAKFTDVKLDLVFGNLKIYVSVVSSCNNLSANRIIS